MFVTDTSVLPTILIVDDQPSNILSIEQAITGLGELFFATSGAQALTIAESKKPDLVLLDIEMPGMNGYEVCQALRAMPSMANSVIIFITSHTEPEKEIEALRLGGADFLHKPINHPIARARVSTHLSLQAKTKQLAASQQNLSDIAYNLPVFIAHWDHQFLCLYSNDKEGAWIAGAVEQQIGQKIGQAFGERFHEQVEKVLPALQESGKVTFDTSMRSPRGFLRYVEVTILTQQCSEGEQVCYLMLLNDITARKQAEDALRSEKERIRVMLESIADAVIATDADGIVTYMNPAAEQMTGRMASKYCGRAIEEVMPLYVGQTSRVLQNPIRVSLIEKRPVGMAIDTCLARADGERLNVEDAAAPIFDQYGDVIGAIIVFHDVSVARQLAIQMTHIVNHDSLTNLPNKVLLRDRTENAIEIAELHKHRVALVMLDLDNFKMINDSIGHSVGDLILQKVALRLKSAIGRGETVCRQGGDEFLILLHEVHDVDIVGQFCESVLATLSDVYLVGDKRFNLSASLGVSIYPDDAEDIEALYRHADSAMYTAKAAGKNKFSFFAHEIEEGLKTKHDLEMRMRAAIESNSFEVFYQPKYCTTEEKIIGAEALVRWRDETGGLISPLSFIPLAEETGLINRIGAFVLKTACKDCLAWQALSPNLKVAVNVSAIQFAQADFVCFINAMLRETGLSPSLLELEVTESVLVCNLENMLIVLKELRGMGVSIAIDDFGTGYSSLTYLKRFPINVLKIDQGFTRDMLHDESDHGIVEAIIRMAGSLKIDLVAEGVETKEIANELKRLGCTTMQGYYYGRPQPAKAFIASLAQSNE